MVCKSSQSQSRPPLSRSKSAPRYSTTIFSGNGADTGGQDSKKKSKGKKKKHKKKETTVEKDSDGEQVDSHSEKADGDGETAGSHSERADNDGEKLDGHGAQEAVGDGVKLDSDQADADTEKADERNDAGEAPPRASAKQKARLTAASREADDASSEESYDAGDA